MVTRRIEERADGQDSALAGCSKQDDCFVAGAQRQAAEGISACSTGHIPFLTLRKGRTQFLCKTYCLTYSKRIAMASVATHTYALRALREVDLKEGGNCCL